MCDQISGLACAEKASDMGSFISQVCFSGGCLVTAKRHGLHALNGFLLCSVETFATGGIAVLCD